MLPVLYVTSAHWMLCEDECQDSDR